MVILKPLGKQGSIKAAAHALHVTPGAVSQQIRLLEDRLGVVLLERERFGMRLSKRGGEVYPLLSDAFAQVDKALDVLAATVESQSSVWISRYCTIQTALTGRYG